MARMTMSDAIVEAIRQEMRNDESIYMLGQDIGQFGGPMQATKGLWEEFGDSGRMIDAPISEEAMIGTAVGAAMTGSRPIVDLMFAEFLALTVTPLAHEGGSIGFKTRGEVTVPMFVRAKCGIGPHHGHAEMMAGMLMSFPGVKVIMPTNPQDAYSLVRAAIRDEGPVVMLEHMSLLHARRAEVDLETTAEIGRAAVQREGNDVTIVASGLMVSRAERAAKTLAEEGIEAEIIDLRSIAPLDATTVVASARKTGAVVVADEAWPTAGPAAEVAHQVLRLTGGRDHIRFGFATSPHTPIPFSTELERAFVPSIEDIVATVRETLAP
ncbi:alpha-ketoacid dehydrogenase subunit beta [Leucobacter sp. UCMA 4100]|uniref:alpha-ketoacid dehydrogenase subunit beta n=1 Tax=Leucobacter sp. UCMA 4100 TaxID=2810534 RepID=UPI0022EAD09D|nr:transketolase C-terminal domain-containing protein [Leucobacter sp. UCMA 4100]MDA3146276.1 alpha-ketoacid dehydrogenase subunit beta [Leucobacter sp. UCMA 4100]